jgi:hypothetical protein
VDPLLDKAFKYRSILADSAIQSKGLVKVQSLAKGLVDSEQDQDQLDQFPNPQGLAKAKV